METTTETTTSDGGGREVPLWVAIVLILAWTAAAFCLGAAVETPSYVSPRLVSGHPADLSEADLTSTRGFRYARVPAMDVVLHLVPVAELHAICGDDADWACSQSWEGYGRPCEIWFPADQVVSYQPWTGRAVWARPNGNPATEDDTFAHELLHCVHPNWHEPFTEVRERVQKIIMNRNDKENRP